MKKFLNVIKRNIFYIALIAGMVALVGLVALYNVKTQSDDENAVSSEAVEETADRSNNREKLRSRNRSKCCQGGRTDRTEL